VTIKTRHNDELDAVVTVLVKLKTPKTIFPIIIPTKLIIKNLLKCKKLGLICIN
jgi:hypothetical protein